MKEVVGAEAAKEAQDQISRSKSFLAPQFGEPGEAPAREYPSELEYEDLTAKEADADEVPRREAQTHAATSTRVSASHPL